MARYQRGFITLADLFRAYRKAKVDAFYESSHFHAIAYARYEKSLHSNLKRLLARLSTGVWVNDLNSLGQCVFVPKSLGVPSRDKGDGVHYATLDHLQDWEASCADSTEEVKANFRQIINPSVDYQIISALWVMRVGHKLDKAIDPTCSYGHRLRRSRGEINLDCSGLFTPYFSAYRDWRAKGLSAMRRELERGQEILAVTMDIRQFYHSVVPEFILREAFLDAAGVSLTEDEEAFSRDLLASIACWYSVLASCCLCHASFLAGRNRRDRPLLAC
ncbi:hypothetical protein [Lysobacter soli]|uniref:hypothetical protein n=1 Tax=Lysobacter soli TaxID=453783 RepID=UPI003CF9F17A